MEPSWHVASRSADVQVARWLHVWFRFFGLGLHRRVVSKEIFPVLFGRAAHFSSHLPHQVFRRFVGHVEAVDVRVFEVEPDHPRAHGQHEASQIVHAALAFFAADPRRFFADPAMHVQRRPCFVQVQLHHLRQPILAVRLVLPPRQTHRIRTASFPAARAPFLPSRRKTPTWTRANASSDALVRMRAHDGRVHRHTRRARDPSAPFLACDWSARLARGYVRARHWSGPLHRRVVPAS
mmetsp:Transcript_6178/g.38419  ORF Transcript_6178/g.38419 Transcript_6178/m.38419 type:complete len:237 (+) Transcript_6178:3294-4004(+)